MSLRQLIALPLLLAVLAVAACGTPSPKTDVHDLARQVAQALETVESYRFEAHVRTEQTGPGNDSDEGDLTVGGAFAAPDRVHWELEGSGGALGTGGRAELVFDGTHLHGRLGNGQWSPGMQGMSYGPLNSVPHLGEVSDWLKSAAFGEGTEVSEVELDGEQLLHMRGGWSQERAAMPVVPQQEGMLEVWISPDDYLVRRAAFTTTFIMPASLNGGSRHVVEGEIRFFDYNAPVVIEAP